MLTFKAEILKSKQKSDGTYNVKIRMTYNREVKRLSTNIFVRASIRQKSAFVYGLERNFRTAPHKCPWPVFVRCCLGSSLGRKQDTRPCGVLDGGSRFVDRPYSFSFSLHHFPKWGILL